MMSYIIVIAAALATIAAWYKFWRGHAARFVESGYVPPATSRFGQFGFACFSYLLTFLTVGKVKVIRKARVPKGRVVFAANHQLPCDFAMLRRGSGRHFRMLTDSAQLGGFFGVLAACGGVISVAFKAKTDGARAEQSCVAAVASRHKRISFALALLAWVGCAAAFVYAVSIGSTPLALGAAVFALAVAGMPGEAPALGIFPEGSLLPDNPNLDVMFRPGAVRIARAAGEGCGESVQIVPMAILYKHDAASADWTHRYLSGMRSMFAGMRNPKVWNPIFKLKLDELPEAEREEIERRKKEALEAYRKSKITNYGGVVVVGEPIDPAKLPADPIEAINEIHKVVAALYEEARRH